MRRRFPRRTSALLFAITVLSCVGTTSPDAPAKKVGPAGLDITSTRPSVVISQVYGGGGNSGAPLSNDFIELFNPGAAAVSLAGWSVQYGSTTSTAAWQVTALTGSIPPGGYYLVQEAIGANNPPVASLPTPDATGAIAMAAGAARVALVNTTTAIVTNPASCPTGVASVVDLVSYGSTSCAGTLTTATLTNTTSASRNDSGCAWTGASQTDFTIGAPAPRNSATASHACGSGTTGPLDHIKLGGPTSVVLGSSIQLTATGFDASNNQLNPQPTITWSSDTPTNVDVNPTTGNASGVAIGTANITATSGSVSATVQITVIAPTNGVVISQVYGGGGNSGATFKNDFIELFNRGGAAVSVDGWSVQYMSANATGTWQVTTLSGSIPPNSYYLVQEAAGAAGTTNLPTPQTIGTIAMSQSDARVALVNTTTALTTSGQGACPTAAASVVDLVAYGTTQCPATFDAPTLSATTADLRINGGCEYSANPNADFVVGAPNPRTAATPARSCTLGPIDHITVTGATAVGVGGVTTLKATAFDNTANNNILTHTTFTWSSDSPNATVDQTGRVTGVTIGPANVSAASSGKTGTLAMSVVDPNAPATITLTSKSAIPYPAGYVDVLLSAVTNGLGSTVTPTLTWTTSDPNVATVDQQGSVLGVGAGTVTITATAPNNVSGTEHLTIEPHTATTTAIYRDHLAFGVPVGADPSDIVLSKTQYVVSYNPNRLGADWVSWNLNGSQFGPAPRCNCFSPDPDLPANVYHVTDFDYTGSGYDRGHMTTSEERTTTDQENATTYILTNVLPQLDANNAGPWEGFENFLNAQAQSGKEIYTVAGPQWGPTVHTLHGSGASPNKVQIPDFTWKVAVILNGGQGLADVHSSHDLQVLAVMMPNLSAADAATGLPGSSAANLSGLDYTPFLTSARAFEQATGLSLLAALPDSIRNIVETMDHPPTASFTGTAALNEGGTASLDGSASTDVDAGDAVVRYVWNFGDGTPAVSGTTPTVSHVFADNGNFTVTLAAYDLQGASGVATRVVAVANVAPTATFTAPTTGVEGSPFALKFTGGTDVSSVDAATLTYAFDCGAGTYGTASSAATATCTPPDNGTFAVRGKVLDKDGGSTEYTASVVVANAAPTAVLNAPATATQGTPFTLSLSNVVDPSSADVAAGLQVRFNCGTGFGAASTATSVSCPANTNTTLTVGATITDKDGGTSSYTGAVVVQQVLAGNTNSCSGNCVIPSGATLGTDLTINAGGVVVAQGTLNGNVTIGAGGKLQLAGGTASKNLDLRSGATLIAQGGTIGGNVQGAGAVSLDAGSSVVGNLQLVGATSISVAATVKGGLQITSLTGAGAICGARIQGDLQLVGGGAQSALTVGDGSECGGNTVGGNVMVTANRGTVSVVGNVITGNLQCQSNTTITSSGNTTINGKKQGQCAQ